MTLGHDVAAHELDRVAREIGGCWHGSPPMLLVTKD
jgi:hypothetical protein